MLYKLIHRTCGGLAGFCETLSHPLGDARANFHYTGGAKASFTSSKRDPRPRCESCKHALDGSDVQPRRLEAPEKRTR